MKVSSYNIHQLRLAVPICFYSFLQTVAIGERGPSRQMQPEEFDESTLSLSSKFV